MRCILAAPRFSLKFVAACVFALGHASTFVVPPTPAGRFSLSSPASSSPPSRPGSLGRTNVPALSSGADGHQVTWSYWPRRTWQKSESPRFLEATSKPLRALEETPIGSSLPLDPGEVAVLNTIFSALGGPGWNFNYGWGGTSTDPCGTPGWFGVACGPSLDDANATTSSVIGLALTANRLRGTLPPLAGLPHLTTIDLSNPTAVGLDAVSNIVGGTLEALCGLGHLETVSLGYNNLTGPLLACAENWTKIKAVDLSYNYLEGTTPSQVCSLGTLETLNLRGNGLTGSVPDCVGSMSALRVMDLTSATRDGIAPGPQSLSGTLPMGFCGLKNLAKLEFQFTQGLVGTIPTCLGVGQLVMTHVVLQGNQFSGPVPASLCSSDALVYLYLHRNELTGTVPACLGSLANMQDLELSTNSLGGTIPEALCGLTQATRLTLAENELTGTVPACLGSLASMQFLDLDTNSLRGTIPESLCGLVQATDLYLAENKLTGTVPACLGSLANMRNLEVSTNSLQGTIPEELCGLDAVELLVLHQNRLSGPLPPCFGTSFPQLQALLLQDNDLDGTFPPQWALPSLISLVASNNPRLGGTLPASLFLPLNLNDVGPGAPLEQGALPTTGNDLLPLVGDAQNSISAAAAANPTLRAVVIEGTGLAGTLPAEVCAAHLLKTLALSGNRFTGPLPECVTGLQELETLHLASNMLDGTLPLRLDNMTALAAIDVSNNEFGGRVPPSLGDVSAQLEEASLDLNRLSCGLPKSVLQWRAKAGAKPLGLLRGNLFGCNQGGAWWALRMSADGLRAANEQHFDSYSCGTSSYVLPGAALTVLALPVVVGLVWALARQCLGGGSANGPLKLSWRATLERRHEAEAAAGVVFDLLAASRELNRLAGGVAFGAGVIVLVVLVLTARAESFYNCEYGATYTLANKFAGSELSAGEGVAVGLGLALSTAAAWAWRWHDAASEERGHSAGSPTAVNYKEMHGGSSGGEAQERLAEASDLPELTKGRRLAELTARILGVAGATVSFNWAFVIVELGNLDYRTKLRLSLASQFPRCSLPQRWSLVRRASLWVSSSPVPSSATSASASACWHPPCFSPWVPS